MLYNILKISLILGVASVALAASIDSQEYVRVGDKFYYFSNDTLSWKDAIQKCYLLEGSVAALEGPSQQEIISNHMVKFLPHDRNWWIYPNDAAVSSGIWAPDQPDNNGGDENCVQLMYSAKGVERYEMNEKNCDQKANYICQYYSY